MIRGSSLTFSDLLLRLAELATQTIRLSASSPVSIAPTDVATLDRLKRAINDGAQEFASATKPTGNGRRAPIDWAWQWQRIEDFTINADGDARYCLRGNARRYTLPGAISFPKNDIVWSDGSTGERVVETTFDALLSAENTRPSETGAPRFWAAEFRPELGGIELRVFPKPDAEYTLSLRCKIGVPSLVNESDRGIWPAVHDRAVLAFAQRCYFRTDRAPDSPAMVRAESMVAEALAASLAADSDIRPESSPSPVGRFAQSGTRVILSNLGTPILDTVVYR